MQVTLKQNEFLVIQKLIFKECGISLSEKKIPMIEARLFKRLTHFNLDSYSQYLKIVQLNKEEKIEFTNALSTNETYFFREMAHYEFLENLAKKSSKLKVWSAAASMGVEAYSVAMVLDRFLDRDSWEVYGSDINTEVIKIAKKGLYPFSWIEKIPQKYKQSYCLKGNGKYENKMLVDRDLASNIEFFRHNLLAKYENQMFDVVFLRNVLLYFKEETKISVIKNMITNVKVGGYLIISMTEFFDEKKIPELKFIANNIYQRV